MKSQYKKLNWKDIAKGFVLSFIGSLVATLTSIITTRINTGVFSIGWPDFRFALIVAAIAYVSYIIKNYFTNSNDQILTKEPTNV